MRNTWLKLARRDPDTLSTKSKLYFCEDHFDLENDMENYTEYKIMGSVKRIHMKPDCIPSRFPNRKHKSTSSELRPAFMKRQRMFTIKEVMEEEEQIENKKEEETIQNENNVLSLPSCSQDFVTPQIKKCDDRAVQVLQARECKATQVYSLTHYRSKNIQASIKTQDSMTSPIKTTVCTATSPIKLSQGRMSKSCVSTLPAATRKLNFLEDKYESDESYTPSIAGATVDYDSSSYEISSQSKATSDTSSQEEFKEVEKVNLLSTLSKIKRNPKLYIGLPKELYFLINLIEKHTNISEQNILSPQPPK